MNDLAQSPQSSRSLFARLGWSLFWWLLPQCPRSCRSPFGRPRERRSLVFFPIVDCGTARTMGGWHPAAVFRPSKVGLKTRGDRVLPKVFCRSLKSSVVRSNAPIRAPPIISGILGPHPHGHTVRVLPTALAKCFPLFEIRGFISNLWSPHR